MAHVPRHSPSSSSSKQSPQPTTSSLNQASQPSSSQPSDSVGHRNLAFSLDPLVRTGDNSERFKNSTSRLHENSPELLKASALIAREHDSQAVSLDSDALSTELPVMYKVE